METETARPKNDSQSVSRAELDPFWSSASAGKMEPVYSFLQNHPSCVDTRNRKDGRTVLHQAADLGLQDAVSLVLEFGAEVDAKDGAGSTPLIYGARRGHAAIVDILIRRGAEPSYMSPEPHSLCALFTGALEAKNMEVAELLLSAGADPHAPLKDGTPLLVHAAKSGFLELVEVLLKFGADPTAKCAEGLSSIEAARKNGHEKVVAVLHRQRASGDSCPPRCRWIERQRESWGEIRQMVLEESLSLWPLSVLQILAEKGRKIPPRHLVVECLRSLGLSSDQTESLRSPARRRLEEAGEETPHRAGFTVVCLSYAWLSKDHPDPDLFHGDTSAQFYRQLGVSGGHRGRESTWVARETDCLECLCFGTSCPSH
uniref:Uncharacterized protein n=1 Tax=Chromera velia CCMP2878 TaxID=1169474 RepID=A0A0G4HRS8_9ALVE|eukprot:Cvel_30769.t1-p1 / transcript=Cvel_30769.t1 / gene=Cvel_30769 / organism=Chromera_velia_CCMP2878 / gene_product=Ankyrin-3, putative / transcript_product=Ankyrin-3, putative / location=Cvel_scaffold4447:6126-7238(-) / protein_length=371 / sequence_SO=supercontig / SO=protein_coding / is_pseudo=false